MIGSPSTGPYFVTSSTGGVTTSPVSGFLIPGLPELLLRYLSVRLDQIHFMTLWYFLTAIMYDFVHWLFCYFSCRCSFSYFFTSSWIDINRCCCCFSPFSPFCTTFSVPGSNFGSNFVLFHTESFLLSFLVYLLQL